MLICKKCKGINVQVKAWVDANTLKYKDICNEGDKEDNWCEDCLDHIELIEKKIKKSK